MNPSKVDAIQSWPEPRNVHDVQSFLGFTNFYRQFIHEYSKMTLPLTTLCQKSTKWCFDKFEKDAFQCLKDAFTMAPILCYWSPDLPMTVEMDASDQAMIAILSVTNPDTEICPVAFSSHSLQGAECNYDTHDKELLAIFQAYKNWCHYLEGSAKVIDTVTDHKNLEYFMMTKKLTQRQVCWSEYLSCFNT